MEIYVDDEQSDCLLKKRHKEKKGIKQKWNKTYISVDFI